tara:strand:- start:481 stop:642 length:162 start_codon:yes stop_codon:yes gene_type:complete
MGKRKNAKLKLKEYGKFGATPALQGIYHIHGDDRMMRRVRARQEARIKKKTKD